MTYYPSMLIMWLHILKCNLPFKSSFSFWEITNWFACTDSLEHLIGSTNIHTKVAQHTLTPTKIKKTQSHTHTRKQQYQNSAKFSFTLVFSFHIFVCFELRFSFCFTNRNQLEICQINVPIEQFIFHWFYCQ